MTNLRNLKTILTSYFLLFSRRFFKVLGRYGRVVVATVKVILQTKKIWVDEEAVDE